MSLRAWSATAISTLLILALSAEGVTAKAVRVARYDGSEMPHGMDVDCVLQGFNACSGWIWICDDTEGAVWGSVLSPTDCPGGCASGGELREIYVYSVCSTSPVRFGGVGVSAVDGVGCRTSLLWQSGPTTIVNCTAENHWTTFSSPATPLNGNPFAVTITWGAQVGGVSQPEFALDCGQANLCCKYWPSQYGIYPGCASSTSSCDGWSMPPQRSYIYLTDFNGDGVLEDICALYGAPYPLAVGYSSWVYYPANLVLGVGLGCTGASPAEATSWGRVKSLFQ